MDSVTGWTTMDDVTGWTFMACVPLLLILVRWFMGRRIARLKLAVAEFKSLRFPGLDDPRWHRTKGGQFNTFGNGPLEITPGGEVYISGVFLLLACSRTKDLVSAFHSRVSARVRYLEKEKETCDSKKAVEDYFAWRNAETVALSSPYRPVLPDVEHDDDDEEIERD